jgi:phosphate transport system ATP-binding protein
VNPARADEPTATHPTFPGAIVQLLARSPHRVVAVMPATVQLTGDALVARVGDLEWPWRLGDVSSVVHGDGEPWTILAVPGVDDHGVSVDPADVAEFRRLLDRALNDAGRSTVARHDGHADVVIDLTRIDPTQLDHPEARSVPLGPPRVQGNGHGLPIAAVPQAPRAATSPPPLGDDPTLPQLPAVSPTAARSATPLARLEAREVSAWFGTHHVLDRVSLDMQPGHVTALIGPSGCGKSTFLRILNRMHEMIPSAALAGEVLLDGVDMYDPARRLTDARRQVGMVFQKPNPFPAMSIYDNVVAGFRLTGAKRSKDEKDEVVETCLSKAGLWLEVKDRLRQPGGGLSGGQQQRLCIARALAIRPRVLLMDEPCSALDPTSTRRIEQTIHELADEVTIVIVTHNMQQAARVSHECAFFLAEHGTPGVIVEHGPTEAMFGAPQDQRTSDYVHGHFG